MDYSKNEGMKYVVVIDNDQICRMIISANLSKKYLGTILLFASSSYPFFNLLFLHK